MIVPAAPKEEKPETVMKKSGRPKKGEKVLGSGRKAGVPNKMNATVTENIIAVFNGLGGTHKMKLWAQKNETKFYQIYAKLIPVSIKGTLSTPLITVPLEYEEYLKIAKELSDEI